MMFKKILVPLDGSELAEKALPVALTLATAAGGEVTTLNVPVYDFSPSEIYIDDDYFVSPQGALYDIESAQTYLDNLHKRLGKTAVPLRRLIREGDPATVIDLVANEDFDLIVMTTHGRSGLTRWIMGSVTERVLQRAPCPVLALRNETPIEKVLITLDGSEVSECAIDPGLAVVNALDAMPTFYRVQEHFARADLRETHLIDKLEPGLGESVRQSFYRQAEYYLEEKARRYKALNPDYKFAFGNGNPAKYILEYAEENDVDLIVMATHGHTGLRRWIYGSVTAKVLRHTDCAMLVVRVPADNLRAVSKSPLQMSSAANDILY